MTNVLLLRPFLITILLFFIVHTWNSHHLRTFSSGCNALVVPFQQLLEGPMEALLCYSIVGIIRGSLNKFQDFFFVWALLLIVHIWNSSPLRSNLFRLQCTCCTVPTTSGRTLGSPLVLFGSGDCILLSNLLFMLLVFNRSLTQRWAVFVFSFTSYEILCYCI